MQIVRYMSDRYEEIAHERCSSADDREGYAEARRMLLIGEAVGARRLNLGLSQTERAARGSCTDVREADSASSMRTGRPYAAELKPARPAYPSATGR